MRIIGAWEATPGQACKVLRILPSTRVPAPAQFDLAQERLIGDTSYGTAPMLAWMVEEKGIKPHVPVWDKAERKDESLSSNDFHWSPKANAYRCLPGHETGSSSRAC